MTNTWKVTIKSDIEGDEPQVITLKGTTSPIVARNHAELIADAQRRRVVDEYGEEHAPNFTVEKVEAVGEDNSPAGTFRPQGAKPIDLDKYVKRTAENLTKAVARAAAKPVK
jgi:hypothetical protein